MIDQKALYQHMRPLMAFIGLDNPDMALALAVGIALIVIFLTILILRLAGGKASRARTILLVGLAESGKTRIFAQLVSGVPVDTVTSMQQTETEVELTDGRRTKKFTLIDIPGYDRLRSKYWDDFKSRTGAIIFVIDSSNISTTIKDAADLLYTLLADPLVQKRGMPILIACNKQDHPLSKTPKVIKNQLEKELNAIRLTRAASLGTTDDGDSQRTILGDPNKELTFANLRNPIEFVACSGCPGPITNSPPSTPKAGSSPSNSANGSAKQEPDLTALVEWVLKVV